MLFDAMLQTALTYKIFQLYYAVEFIILLVFSLKLF